MQANNAMYFLEVVLSTFVDANLCKQFEKVEIIYTTLTFCCKYHCFASKAAISIKVRVFKDFMGSFCSVFQLLNLTF